MATKVSSLDLIGFFIIFFPRGLQEKSPIRAEPLHLVMMRPFLFLLHRLPSQEFVFFLLFLAVCRALRIVPLHFHAFFRGELRKMANEAHQLPAILLRSVCAPKCRHACEAHAIFDNPENGVRFTGMPAFGGAHGSEQDSWKLVRFIRHLPQLTAEERMEMERYNPKSPADREEEQEENEFLGGKPMQQKQ